MSRHVTFYDYVIDDSKSKEYDPTLPLGGIRKDAPREMVEAYNRFVKEYNSSIDKLVSEGESRSDAEELVKKHCDWVKSQITKKCSNAWKEHKRKQKEHEIIN